MAKTKTNTVLSLAPEIKAMAKEDAKELLGSDNLTGYVTYLINKENKNKNENTLEKNNR